MTSEDIEQFYDYFNNCYDTLISESSNTSFIAVGDFSPTGNGFHPKSITRHSKPKQIIKEPTRGSNILDLVFTDISAMFESPQILAPVGSSDHATVLVESKVHAPKKKVIRKVIVRLLKESSLPAFDDYLKQIDWSPVLFEDHVDNKVKVFLELTCSMIDTFFPTKTVKVHDEDKTFLTGEINNGNCTDWSAIWSEIKRVITSNHKFDFRPKLHDTKCNFHFIVFILIFEI